MPVVLRPLLGDRSGARRFLAPSPGHETYLAIPQGRGGRVRFEAQVVWFGPPGPRFHRLPIALTWPKTSRLPAPQAAADAIRAAISSETPSRTRRPKLDAFRAVCGKWKADVFTRRSDRLIRPAAPVDEMESSLRLDLAWAYRLLKASGRRWPSYRDRWRWIYRAHQCTALMAADEIATRYLTDRSSLERQVNRRLTKLDASYPQLRARIGRVYSNVGRGDDPNAGVTPRRLAVALVDALFEKLFDRPLLDPERAVGLEDGRLWEVALPPAWRPTLTALCPTPTIYDLLSWPQQDLEVDQAAGWFVAWWWGLMNVEGPLLPGYGPDTPPPRPGTYLLEMNGAEDWANTVWSALYS